MKVVRSLWMPFVFGLLIIGAWFAAKALFGIESYILPSPIEIISALKKEKALLLGASLTTMLQSLYGFLAAIAVGSLTALLLSLSKTFRNTLYPWILTIQLIPTIILAPILVLWLGHGTISVCAMTFLICFFPIVANTTAGLISTNRSQLELFQSFEASPLQTLFFLKLPHALPSFLNGLKIAATLAPIGAITGDIFVGTSAQGSGGLGFLVIMYYAQMKIPALFAAALITCLVGFSFVSIIYFFNWLLLSHWHESWKPIEK